ncbi:MAG TPA: hypothetical protein VFZ31_03995 [Vicinamibacterales bacterium]
MTSRHIFRNTAAGMAGSAALAAAGYAAVVAYNRARYGSVDLAVMADNASLIDRFIPHPEVIEHNQIAVNAPADIVLAAAKEMELMSSPLVRSIIKARELVLGGEPDERPHPAQLLDQMKSIGWVVLAEMPGREVVMGAVTQPWQAAPVFRSIPPDEFLAFAEPGYVKIAWTLRASPLDARRSMFHTETRVATTDADARDRFRTYWSFVAPGVKLIRAAMLRPLKRAAEKRWKNAAA